MKGHQATGGLTAAVLALSLVSGCSRREPAPTAAEPPAAVVRVQTAAWQGVTSMEEAPGTVRSRLRSVVEAKVSGRIERMLASQGQSVKLGDLLAELDVREIRARLEQALASRDQAERDLQRFRTLLDQKVITQAEFDTVQSRQRIAAAAVSEAEAMLAYARITAPFDGVVVRKLTDVGDLAAPGKPLLELEQLTALRLEADVAEALIGRVEAGGTLRVRIPALGREVEARVGEIAPAADPASRTVLVKLELPALEGLRSGMFGRVSIPTGEAKVLAVPAAAVTQRGQMEILFVVEEGRAHLRLVRTGRRSAGAVEVIAGLGAGEVVVVEAATGLADGQPVQVRN